MADVPIDIETVSFVITMLGIALAVTIGLIQFRNLVKARQIEVYMEIYNKFTEKDVLRMGLEVSMLWKWKDVNQFFEKYGPEKNPDEFMKWVVVTTHLENMGFALKEKLVNVRMVAYLVGTVIQGLWEKYEPILTEFKRRYKTPRIMPMTEYLYKRIKQVRPA